LTDAQLANPSQTENKTMPGKPTHECSAGAATAKSLDATTLAVCKESWQAHPGGSFLESLTRAEVHPTTTHWLWVRLQDQEMDHFDGDRLLRRYTVSTSLRPPSCIENSLGTPTGLHEIADKIGAGAPLGMVFKGRRATGRLFSELSTEENQDCLVTTRILRLRGLEEGHNAGPGRDSYDRYIYIHGTNHEERLGTPQSAGCVVLRNTEVVELFDGLPSGALVWIA
jgi:hypothetical protein